MTKIPVSKDPLVDMLDAIIIEESNKEEQRTYLGASSIGDECARKLWYKFNGEKEYFDAKTLRKFADGHRTEEVILEWLGHCTGIELYTRGFINGYEGPGRSECETTQDYMRGSTTDQNGDVPNHRRDVSSQIGFELYEGMFKGHYDGIARGFPQAPKTWHIVEIKCVNERAFKEICVLKEKNEKTAIRLWRPEYYSQVQVYMHQEKLTRSIHIISTPGARDLVSVRTNYDKDHAEAMLAKAMRIIDAKSPPERIGDQSFYKCRMCFMRDKCHGA